MYYLRMMNFENRKYADKFFSEIIDSHSAKWQSSGVKVIRGFIEDSDDKPKSILFLHAERQDDLLKSMGGIPIEGMWGYEDIPVTEADYFPMTDSEHTIYQLRIYSIKEPDAAKKYMDIHWKRHLTSLPKFKITVEGIFCENSTSGKTRVFALGSFEDGSDVKKINKSYMRSFALLKDMIGFNVTKIANVEEVMVRESIKLGGVDKFVSL
jgi:hypothetical protein